MLKMAPGTIGVGDGDIILLLVSAPGIIGVGDGNITTVTATMIEIGMITTVTMTMTVAD
jgi:hypothetical protein